ncbi:MAG: hypothetical protein WB626_12775, partial [Bacteroidota bacterium]
DASPVNALFDAAGIGLRFDAEFVTVINAGTIILLQVLVSRIVRNTPALPTMVAGMFIGTLGFICLAYASNVWVFILGIAVFSIGEMTAHPKYYSYVGLVAPAETKAVYMGYAFLYGVIGSLLGSNLGGTLYETMLKPVVRSADPSSVIRTFWLLFAGMNLLAITGLILYNRYFAADTPATRHRARTVMLALYALLLATGALFLVSAFGETSVSYKTAIQSLIMMTIGGAGLFISLRHQGRPGPGG